VRYASPLHARGLRTSPENASNLRLAGEQGEFELQGDFVNGQLVPLRPLADLSHSDLIFSDASLEPAHESSGACTAQSFATVEQVQIYFARFDLMRSRPQLSAFTAIAVAFAIHLIFRQPGIATFDTQPCIVHSA
jgi:hypothetical protein